MKKVRLNNGVVMPSIGFGVYQIPAKDTERCVSDALEVGYRMIDTAAAYLNEKEVGNAIRNSALKREDIFVTTKLWVQDYEYDDALKAFDKSMSLLGLDYLDLWLLHKPYGNYYAAWRAAEKLYREGRIKAIGVTSFSDERLLDLMLHNEIKPMVNQIETNPWRQQKESNIFLQQEGIQQETWAPFAEGTNDIFNNPALKSIADKHRKSVAQVILRWLNQRNIIVIPKSTHKERMAENFNIFDFTLTPEEMAKIATLDTGKSTIYDETQLDITRFIGTNKIHD
ncbi:MAG: aldo/keto reductase [Muribaculum sp.]|nr:aldo/keto reductase [Muribaculum sp.]